MTAGLDGVRRELDPGEPQQANTYDLLAEGTEFERVPDHLGAALEALAADDVVRGSMPGRLYDVFNHYKQRRVGALPGGGHRLGARRVPDGAAMSNRG